MANRSLVCGGILGMFSLVNSAVVVNHSSCSLRLMFVSKHIIGHVPFLVQTRGHYSLLLCLVDLGNQE